MKDVNDVTLFGRIVSELEKGKNCYEFTLRTRTKRKEHAFEVDHSCKVQGEKLCTTATRLLKGDRLFIQGNLTHDHKISVSDLTVVEPAR